MRERSMEYENTTEFENVEGSSVPVLRAATAVRRWNFNDSPDLA
jgi:hypothetical protein